MHSEDDDVHVLTRRNTISFPAGVIQAMLEGTARRIASLICVKGNDEWFG
jgi:hypothetical protein